MVIKEDLISESSTMLNVVALVYCKKYDAASFRAVYSPFFGLS